MMLLGHEPSCLQPKLIFTPPSLSGSILVVVEPSGPGTSFQLPRNFSHGLVMTPVVDCCAAGAAGRDRQNKAVKSNARRMFASSQWKGFGLWANSTSGG